MEFRMLMDSVNITVLIIIFGLGGWLNRDDLKQAWVRFKERVKPIRDWLLKQWANNPFLFIIIIAFALILIAFVVLFLGRLYPLTDSLYKLVFKYEVANIDIKSRAFQNVSFLIAGSATFVFAVLGMFLSVIRNILTRHQNKISEQGQITESMGRAIEQIGALNGEKPNIEVRVGGLYSLQFIMQDSPRHEEAIANIFSTYIRENTKKDKNEKPRQAVIKKSINELLETRVQNRPRADIQVAFEIISQFNQRYKQKVKGLYSNIKINFSNSNFKGYFFHRINFSGAILGEVDFSDADLVDVNFSNAHLMLADFSNAKLNNVNLHNAMLYIARFPNAFLFDANLSSAELVTANLFNAILTQANLKDARLLGANLCSADLSSAKNLTQEQIDEANGDKHTKIPKGLTRPESWGEYEED